MTSARGAKGDVVEKLPKYPNHDYISCMRTRKKLRWIKRRETKKSSWAAMPFEVIDLVVLTLIIALSILVLRISFIYATTQSSSDSAFHAFGKSLGLGSAFDLGLILSGLLFVIWTFISLSRLSKIKRSLSLLIWHLFIFVGIGLLAYGSFIAVRF